MSQITKNHYLLLCTIAFFVISSYLLKLTLVLINKESFDGEQPVNYNIFEDEGKTIEYNQQIRKFDSNYISLSNEMINIFNEHDFTIENFIDGKTKKIVIFSNNLYSIFFSIRNNIIGKIVPNISYYIYGYDFFNCYLFLYKIFTSSSALKTGDLKSLDIKDLPDPIPPITPTLII